MWGRGHKGDWRRLLIDTWTWVHCVVWQGHLFPQPAFCFFIMLISVHAAPSASRVLSPSRTLFILHECTSQKPLPHKHSSLPVLFPSCLPLCPSPFSSLGVPHWSEPFTPELQALNSPTPMPSSVHTLRSEGRLSEPSDDSRTFNHCACQQTKRTPEVGFGFATAISV